MAKPFSPRLLQEHLKGARLFHGREAMIASFAKGGVVAEVGTEAGRFAARILALAEPGELHLIDNDWNLFESGLLADGLASGQVVRHDGLSTVELGKFPDGTFDWIYIDADHAYASVVADLDVAKRKIKPSGMLVLNDYTRWTRKAYEYGVMPAVNELVTGEDWRVIALALDRGGYNDIAISRAGLKP
ncbi:MAG: class I SAM-dependent methyltransferase [Hyphomicrobiaceae bacterium]|nr:MAG: class I SAM-dependent methyltransferase [Hyphomicrobiaceae bacterium]